MKGDYKVLVLTQVTVGMRRSMELGRVYAQHRKTGLSEDEAASLTLQTLTEEEGRRLWKMTGKTPPADWLGEITFTKVSLPYGWLGNMAPYAITYEGLLYRTSEALFQSLRFTSYDVRELIRAERSPMSAKMVAKSHALYLAVEPRSKKDLDNMRLVLRLKLEQHPSLAPMLKATGEATIIEDCTARPRGSGLFWGAAREPDGGWRGENWLGSLWMELRGKEAA